MDGWQRRKRTFTQMSQSATLSPSPALNFGDSASSNFFARAGPSAPANDLSSFFRRRTSHPHNHTNNTSQPDSVEMAEASQSQRPRLEHRSSQTIIDLTDDNDEILVSVPQRSRQNRSRAPRPPQFGRSDSMSLRDLIDLTDDSDIIITGERQTGDRQRSQQQPGQSLARPAPPRHHSPPLFVPNRPQHAQVNGVVANPHAIGYISGAIGHFGGGHVIPDTIRNFLGIHMIHHDHMQQAMPGAMNYHHAAFAERKPDHIAPIAVPQGFTRSPTDSDMIICPSCEEELVHRKEDEEPPLKKGSRAPSRKDREEHPFWVIKECGHVYCNKCYQLRQQTSKHTTVQFREVERPAGKKTKILTCAVEDCSSDVKSKDKWVGVFL